MIWHSTQNATLSKKAGRIKSTLSGLLSRDSLYQYEPLKRGQMRLLELWPGLGNTQIRSLLHAVSIYLYDDRMAKAGVSYIHCYDAISYVWGKGPKTETIICGDSRLRVTSNLANALRRFRDASHTIFLWVDAICINQMDLDELAEQVQLMGLIYYNARKVRIWLGFDDEPVYTADHAATLIRKFTDPYHAEQNNDARSLSERIFSQHTDSDNVKWAALHRLLDREWFKRVWVVQELGLSRDATFYCGSTEITRNQLYDFVHLLEHSRSGLLISYDIDLRMLRLGQRYQRATWATDRIKLGSGAREAETYLDLLSKTRGLRCTDQRDSIYAFLGHPSAFKKHKFDDGPYQSYPDNFYDNRPPIIRPNYDISATFLRACTDLAINLVNDQGLGLQLLAHVAHDERTITLNVPSWVPLWDVLVQSSHFHSYEKLYNASGSLQTTSVRIYTPTGDPCRSRMSLRALPLARVLYTTAEPATLSVQTLVETLFPERVAGSSYLKLHALAWPIATSRLRNAANDWPALAMTLTAGLITTDTHLVPVHAEGHLSRHVRGLESFLRRYERGPPQIQCSKDDDIAENFHMDIGRAGYSRSFYFTSDSQFGLAPMITQEGDEVWLPMGATMPFVLRPLSKSVFRIIGQTYLHGLMHREAISSVSSSSFQTILLC